MSVCLFACPFVFLSKLVHDMQVFLVGLHKLQHIHSVQQAKDADVIARWTMAFVCVCISCCYLIRAIRVNVMMRKLLIAGRWLRDFDSSVKSPLGPAWHSPALMCLFSSLHISVSVCLCISRSLYDSLVSLGLSVTSPFLSVCLFSSSFLSVCLFSSLSESEPREPRTQCDRLSTQHASVIGRSIHPACQQLM